jgi:outer membrane PBP1 activator LpoA protein
MTIGLTPEMLAALTRPWEELSESQKKEIAKLQGDLDLNQRQVKSALEILGEKNVPPERLAAKLVEIAGKFRELQTAAVAQPGDDAKITALKAEAQKAIQDGQLGKADENLAAIEKIQTEALDRLALNAAQTTAQRGVVALTGCATPKRRSTSPKLRQRCRKGMTTNAGNILTQRQLLFTGKAMNLAIMRRRGRRSSAIAV